jgi:hypothetical protein
VELTAKVRHSLFCGRSKAKNEHFQGLNDALQAQASALTYEFNSPQWEVLQPIP